MPGDARQAERPRNYGQAERNRNPGQPSPTGEKQMNDLINRLREGQPGERQGKREARCELHSLLYEAAAEIERLMKECRSPPLPLPSRPPPNGTHSQEYICQTRITAA
jgi:hypothetical protein